MGCANVGGGVSHLAPCSSCACAEFATPKRVAAQRLQDVIQIISAGSLALSTLLHYLFRSECPKELVPFWGFAGAF